jgi:hypothetical protein
MHEGDEIFTEEFVRTRQGKRPGGRHKLTWDCTIAVDHREILCKGLNSQINIQHYDKISGYKKIGNIWIH